MTNTIIRKTPFNYSGNKFKLIEKLKLYIPENIDTFYDLFAGGCTVSINVSANKIVANDINKHLVSLFQCLQSESKNGFIAKINELIDTYGFSKSWVNGISAYTNLNKKTAKDGKPNTGLDEYNLQPYVRLRNDFNQRTKAGQIDTTYRAMFYLLIVHSYCYQIRFNASGGFNMPVGRSDWNMSMQSKLTDYIDHIQSTNIEFTNNSYLDFDISNFKKEDFVYLDPPYLISTASYNESDGWNENHERQLLAYLEQLNQNGIRFMLSNVLEHKGMTNTILQEWVKDNNFTCIDMNHNYKSSFAATAKRIGHTKEVVVKNC